MRAVQVTGRVLAWLAAALVVLALLAQPGGPLGTAAYGATSLRITGHIEGLEPGIQAELMLTLENPGPEAVPVRRVTATASGGTAACGAEHLTASPWTGELLVPAHGSADVALVVTVDEDPACAGQSWGLDYTATA